MTTPTHKLENFPTSSESLREVLKSNARVGRVWVFEEIASTQTFLESVENLTVGDIAVARHQTAGRGRLSRTWNDLCDSSILLSIALPVTNVLTLSVGVGVLNALSAISSTLTLKWPNDIVVVDGDNYKKVGGIITTGLHDEIAIVGIGINLIAPETESHALGLIDLANQSLDVTSITKSVIDAVLLHSSLQDQVVIERFRLHTSTLHRQVRIKAINGKSIYGYVAEIAADGALLVETDNGQIRIVSGDVEYLRFSES